MLNEIKNWVEVFFPPNQLVFGNYSSSSVVAIFPKGLLETWIVYLDNLCTYTLIQ